MTSAELGSDEWRLEGQNAIRVRAANRVATTWVGELSDDVELVVHIDDYASAGAAQRNASPPEKTLSAPNFEVTGLGDTRRIWLEGSAWTDFVVCARGEPIFCSWWAYYAELGRYRVTVVYRDYRDQPLHVDAFSALALETFEAASVDSRR